MALGHAKYVALCKAACERERFHPGVCTGLCCREAACTWKCIAWQGMMGTHHRYCRHDGDDGSHRCCRSNSHFSQSSCPKGVSGRLDLQKDTVLKPGENAGILAIPVANAIPVAQEQGPASTLNHERAWGENAHRLLRRHRCHCQTLMCSPDVLTTKGLLPCQIRILALHRKHKILILMS